MNYNSKISNNSRVAIVTMDRTQWANKTKFGWIFWLAVLLSLSVFMGACKSGASDVKINAADTAGLAAFNAQKAADSLAALPADLQTFQGENDESYASQSFTSTGDEEEAYNDNTGAMKSVNDDNGAYVDNNSGGSVDENADLNTATAEPATQKKRFSNAAKGAVIGAGSGAVIGAIVAKKNRGLGAVIGAAIGGGTGYGIGKHKDNKEASETN